MDKKIKMAAGAGLAALALIVSGGGYYYFHVKTDTPDYALKTVSQSIEKHDVKNFHRVVNVDSLLDSGYDGFIDGLTAVDGGATPEAKEAIKNFTQMLRSPMILSLKAALDSYVATGDFKPEENVGLTELLERTGLSGIEVRDVKNIQINDANDNEAFADVIIFQPELEREFPLQIVLSRGKDDQWQITRVQNFQEYVAQISQLRRTQLEDYLVKSAEINAKHDTVVREAEKKYSTILSIGTLGQDKTRADLKELFSGSFKQDWETRKQELFNLHVPKDALHLHNIYIKICDLWIDAAQDYVKWLDDNNALTIKSAEDKIHQAQNLSMEAAALAKRMTS